LNILAKNFPALSEKSRFHSARSHSHLWIFVLIGGCFFCPPLQSSDTVKKQGWNYLTQLKTGEAAQAFSGNSREERYGKAVATLNLQPRTEANLNTASTVFEELLAEKNDDEIAVHSAYQLARILHVQRNKPDPNQAAEKYENLMRQYPGHPLADAAAVKLTILRLYTLNRDLPAAERVELVDPLGANLHDKDAIRDYHLVMADAVGFLRLEPAKALEHLKKAYGTSRVTGKLQADVLVRISEISAKTGDQALSREFAERFVKQFPRDERASSLRKKWEIQP
jgi:outer membrane protein assembly factor BamD (BamD/ComL family)